MGGIILGLLRGIGWIILILLLVLLALLFLVLFVPITYRINGEKTEEILHGSVKVNWLFGLIRFRLTYEKQLLVNLYVLWMDLLKKRGRKTSDKPSRDAQNSPGGDTVTKREEKDRSSSAAPSDAIEESDTGKTAEEKLPGQSTESVEAPKQEETGQKKSFFQKMKELPGKIRDKIIGLLDTISYYKDLLEHPNTKRLWEKGKRYLLRILKAICPRKCRGRILYGTGSPDTTGYLYAVYGVLSPRLGRHFTVSADFENTILQGEVFARGRIYVFTLMVNGLCILLMKELRIFWKEIKSRR